MLWQLIGRPLGVVAAVAVIGLTPAIAEMVIELKDGSRITLPYSKEDVAAIRYGGAEKAAEPPANANVNKPPAGATRVPIQNARAGAPAAGAKAPRKAKNIDEAAATVSDADLMQGYKQEPLQVGGGLVVIEPEGSAEMREVAAGLPESGAFLTDIFRRTESQPEQAAGTGTVWRVGPGEDYERPSEVAKVAKNGDVVEIAGAIYVDDNVVWRQDNLVLRGVKGRPHLRSTSMIKNGKAIWVFSGDNVVVENIEFSGAKVPHKNGAGIRAEGGKLTVRNSYFHHNQRGLMSSNLPTVQVIIEGSEFAYHLIDGRYTHSVYIGENPRFVIKNSYVHHTHRGHHVKSRAAENFILYNKLTDETGTSSYQIDLPVCGKSYVIGNIMHQGSRSENYNGINYGAEGCGGRPRGLMVVNNTFFNELGKGQLLVNKSFEEALMANNLVINGKLAEGPIRDVRNKVLGPSAVASTAALDLSPAANSPAIDAGMDVSALKLPAGASPDYQYHHPMRLIDRRVQGKIDIGALEFGS